MNFRRAARRRAREFELVPLIDVVFTLLLFFALTTTFARPEDPRPVPEAGAAEEPIAGIGVELPRAGAEAMVKVGKEVAVLVTRDGGLFLGGLPVTLPELSAAFRQAAIGAVGTTVVIRADAAASHGRVVEVMDLARELGLTDFAIATEQGP